MVQARGTIERLICGSRESVAIVARSLLRAGQPRVRGRGRSSRAPEHRWTTVHSHVRVGATRHPCEPAHPTWGTALHGKAVVSVRGRDRNRALRCDVSPVSSARAGARLAEKEAAGWGCSVHPRVRGRDYHRRFRGARRSRWGTRAVGRAVTEEAVRDVRTIRARGHDCMDGVGKAKGQGHHGFAPPQTDHPCKCTGEAAASSSQAPPRRMQRTVLIKAHVDSPREARRARGRKEMRMRSPRRRESPSFSGRVAIRQKKEPTVRQRASCSLSTSGGAGGGAAHRMFYLSPTTKANQR